MTYSSFVHCHEITLMERMNPKNIPKLTLIHLEDMDLIEIDDVDKIEGKSVCKVEMLNVDKMLPIFLTTTEGNKVTIDGEISKKRFHNNPRLSGTIKSFRLKKQSDDSYTLIVNGYPIVNFKEKDGIKPVVIK